jgi:DNA invertase Pin-like site-specific DNA recombinase
MSERPIEELLAAEKLADVPGSVAFLAGIDWAREFSRTIIRERTKAGLAAAKARGSVAGRPKGYRKVDGVWMHTLREAAANA